MTPGTVSKATGDSLCWVLSAKAKTENDALFYLDQIKMKFSEKQEVYNEFLEIMKSYKDKRYVLAYITHTMKYI